MLLQQLMQANIFCLSDKHLELRNNKTLRVGYNAEVFYESMSIHLAKPGLGSALARLH